MTEAGTRLEYFDWLCESINGKYSPDISAYSDLLMYLNDVEFNYLIPMDGNRAEDGVNLRYIFANERGINQSVIASCLDVRPCTMLEMMVALAQRCETSIMHDEQFGNRTSMWFWGMIDSLGLSDQDDANFDPVIVDDILDRFMARDYEPNGDGGLFTIPNCDKDLRRVEIWYQMCWYLNTLLEKEN